MDKIDRIKAEQKIQDLKFQYSTSESFILFIMSIHVNSLTLYLSSYSTTTRSVAPRPKVSGWYISSAFVGGTTNEPGVVARATYEYV
jgi:hypothetical protein